MSIIRHRQILVAGIASMLLLACGDNNSSSTSNNSAGAAHVATEPTRIFLTSNGLRDGVEFEDATNIHVCPGDPITILNATNEAVGLELTMDDFGDADPIGILKPKGELVFRAPSFQKDVETLSFGIFDANGTGERAVLPHFVIDKCAGSAQASPANAKTADEPSVTVPVETSVTDHWDGSYSGRLDGGDGELEIGGTAEKKVLLSVASEGCAGGIGFDAQVPKGDTWELTSKDENENECKITLRRDGDKIQVEEDSCMSHHGASCAFDGLVIKK